MIGKYKINSENLININMKCKELSSLVKNISYEHIYRNKNTRADELSNIAIQYQLEQRKILKKNKKNPTPNILF